jgi:hypothetical protein
MNAMQTGRIEIAKLRFGIMAALGLCCAAGVGLGCGSNNNGQTPSGGTIHSTTGGGAGNGAAGSAGNGAAGSAGSSTGGASTSPSTGGSTGNATGGSSAGETGGSAAGGASVAGSSATGGVSTAGGSVATGGASVTGGSISGGTSATGGSTTGGASATGGATKTGGTTSGGAGSSGSATGGSAAGGSTGGSQGGTSSTGGSSGGSTSTGACAPRVLSLSSNATGSAADTAYAHVEVDMGSDLPIANAARTVEFWALIKTTDWVGEKNELYYYGPVTGATTGTTFGLDFGTNDVTGSKTNHATLNPFTNGGFTVDSTNDLGIDSSTNQWVHIAMTWDQTVLVTYVNGLPKITITATGGVTALSTTQSTLFIGCNPTNKNCFNGEFAEFRVWKVARSATDILANYKKPMTGNESGLVGYWKFDDASTATSAADSVTTTGHTAHPGTLKATTPAQNPTFVAPTSAVPLTCP